MLYKKELEQIPLPGVPKTKKERSYSSHVEIHNLDKSGQIIAIDIFKNKDIALRFFSDGKTFLISKDWPAREWIKRNPESMLQGSVSDCEEDRNTVNQFLDSTPYAHNVKEYMCAFVREINAEKRDKQAQVKHELKQKHFNMFPEYPDDLKDYCEKHVFKETILFVSKINKGKRDVICGHCGKKYQADKDTSKPGNHGKCTKCGFEGDYKGVWNNGRYEKKENILIAGKYDNQLLLRWTEVNRHFEDGKVAYSFYDYYRNLYLYTNNKQTLYGYKYQNIMYYGWDWYRKQNGEVNYEETFVYTNNLNEVFGEKYYNVNLQKEIDPDGKIKFTRLLDNLKNIPAAEQLFKMGLTQLASHYDLKSIIEDGKGFSGILGINKSYLPMYKKYDITADEHNVIKAQKAYISEESFLKFRSFNFSSWEMNNIEKMLNTMTIEKFTNYISKQREKSNCNDIYKIVTWYTDYISICKKLGVDLKRKSVRYPDNLNYAHALIVARNNKIKGEERDKLEKEKIERENKDLQIITEKLYKELGEYRKGELLITYPTSREDFIIEGTSLNHCVAGGEYLENHIEGHRIIAFVRKAIQPHIPYFTIEINLNILKVMQLYGFGDHNPPAEVKKFVDGWVWNLKTKVKRKAS